MNEIQSAAIPLIRECNTLISGGTRHCKEVDLLLPHTKRMIVIEPDKKPYEQLSRFKSINSNLVNHKELTVLNVALWSEPGEMTLSTRSENLRGICPSLMFNTSGQKVLCNTLDNLDEVHQFGDNLFLWLDIEGSELNALKGASNVIPRCRYIYCELWPANKRRSKDWAIDSEIIDLLKSYGLDQHKYKSKPLTHGHYDVIFCREEDL